MKRITLLIVAFLALGITAAAQVQYSTYTNVRFAYRIDYPSRLLKMQPGPENDDGRTFRSKDGSVEMRAWGSYNALFSTMDEKYADAVKVLDGKPTYSKLGKKDYAFSGYKGDKIYYERVFVVTSTDGDTYLTFTIEYPKRQKAKWDPIVTHIAGSLKSIAVESR